jgi:tetratricopeptide (TPR) repeat protein
MIFSQAGRGIGRLRGNVTDGANNPIAGAKITLSFLGEDGNVRTAVTDNEGIWAFIGLGFGKYDVTAEKEGFDILTKRIMVSQVRRNAFLNLRLETSKKETLKKKLLSVETGLELFREKKYDEALEFFTEFSTQNPAYYQVGLFIANCYKEKGEYDKAIQHYMQVNSEADKTGDTVYAAKGLAGIGEVYILKKDLTNAQHYFKSSIQINPKDEVLAYNVGEIYFGNNNTEGAITYFKLATEIKPEWSIPYLKLGYASLNKGDMTAAIGYFREFLKRDQDSPEAATVKEIISSLENDIR